MEDETWMPRVDEPMGDYLLSERYRKSQAMLTFSDFEGQEEANYIFWRHLTPAQRLELHTIMVTSLYADESNINATNPVFEIVFTENGL
jgi:hypothetical protein